MATEETTQPDTQTSETSEPAAVVVDATEQPTAADAEADDAVADATDAGETSVLGGKLEGGAEAKTEATEEPAGPPEKYELALEGVTLEPEALEAAEPVFRELNLTNDQANLLMPVAKDFAERTAAATLQQIMDAGAQQKKDWLDAFKADPEIGGANQSETEHLAAKGLDALGFAADHSFRKALTETGFGNHPDMIRAFRKVGEMVGEGGFIRADAAAPTNQPTEKRWYNSEKKGD